MFNWPTLDWRVEGQAVVHSHSSLRAHHCRGIWKMFQGFWGEHEEHSPDSEKKKITPIPSAVIWPICMKRFLLPERFQHKLLLVSTQYDLLTWTNCLEKCVDSKIMISEIELSTCETRAFFFFIKQPDCQTGWKQTNSPSQWSKPTHARLPTLCLSDKPHNSQSTESQLHENCAHTQNKTDSEPEGNVRIYNRINVHVWTLCKMLSVWTLNEEATDGPAHESIHMFMFATAVSDLSVSLTAKV